MNRPTFSQGLKMVAGGAGMPALIENAAFAAGMPQGPLAMASENPDELIHP